MKSRSGHCRGHTFYYKTPWSFSHWRWCFISLAVLLESLSCCRMNLSSGGGSIRGIVHRPLNPCARLLIYMRAPDAWISMGLTKQLYRGVEGGLFAAPPKNGSLAATEFEANQMPTWWYYMKQKYLSVVFSIEETITKFWSNSDSRCINGASNLQGTSNMLHSCL